MTDTYVKFKGANASVENPQIALGDRIEFSGMGECVFVGTEKRADGEARPVVSIKVEEVDLGAVTPAPKDDQLPFNEDDAAAGDDEPEGDA